VIRRFSFPPVLADLFLTLCALDIGQWTGSDLLADLDFLRWRLADLDPYPWFKRPRQPCARSTTEYPRRLCVEEQRRSID
jgi:hypothetical protein